MVSPPKVGMRPRRGWPRSHRSVAPAAVLCLVVALAMALPGVAAGSTGSGRASAPLAASAAVTSVDPASFATRAGYSPSDLSEVSDPVAAGGAEEVELTFAPTTSAFFEPPSPGTAPMSTSAIADEFGLSPSQYLAAEQYFESEGLVISHAWPDRLSLSLEGPATAIDRAFSTSLVSGEYEGRPVTLPAVAPTLPSGLEAEVSAVTGLSSGLDSFALPELPTTPAGDPAQSPTDLITPAIARGIYDVSGLYNLTASPTYATGKGIVLLLWGLGYDPSDIQTFYSQDYPSTLPQPQVVPYPIDGAPAPSSNAANDPSNGSRELTLDLEWSGSMAPGATLDAVYAPMGPASNDYSPTDASMIDALNTAVDESAVPNVATISMSFGSADGQDPGLTSAFETDFAAAARENITVFAATGDLGGDSESNCQGGPGPEYPAASPQVVAVGGTSVTLERSVLGAISGFTESAWSQSGGGFSTQFAAPSWQEVGSAAGPIEANGHRGMPDVAATAGYNFLYFDGQDAAGGGTSFATPLWAGLVTEMDALRGANFGFLTPELYALGADNASIDPPYHDVTSGGNCLGSAGPGWDTATGWGSPSGVNLYEHLIASFVNLTLAATPTVIAPGGAVTVTATIVNYTSGAPIDGASVVVTLTSNGIGGPCSGTFGTVTPVSNQTGAIVATISVPLCYLGSSAVATAMVASGGYYGVESATVHVNLLGFAPSLAALGEYPGNVVFFVVIMAIAVAAGAYLGRTPVRRARASAAVPPSTAAPSTGPSPSPPPASSPAPDEPPGVASPPAASPEPPFSPPA